MPYAFFSQIIEKVLHGSTLVIAREDDGFTLLSLQFTCFPVVLLLLILLHEQIVLQEVHERVFTQDISPKVFCAYSLIRNVYTFGGLVLKETVEWEETRFLANQACCHEHLFGATSKVNEDALKLQCFLTLDRTVLHILFDGILMVLASKCILQFYGSNR